LQTAQSSLQACLDVWVSLELIPFTDIFSLILNPQKAFGDAVNTLADPPVMKGRFQVSKEAFISTLEIPIPDSLYRICRDARKLPFTNIATQWSIVSDKVVMNMKQANELVESQSIWVTTDEQKKLAENILMYVKLTNFLNEKLELLVGSPVEHQFFMGKLLVSLAKHLTYPEVSPEKLSESQLLQVLEYLKQQENENKKD